MKRTIKSPIGTQLTCKNWLIEAAYRMIQKGFKLHFFLFLVIISFAIGNAQEKEEVIKINTILVNIPVIVSDRNGRYISGLQKEDFFIVENGEKRQVDFFADQQSPMSVAIVIDVSPSTRNILDKIKDATLEFIKVLRPDDQAMIVSFDYEMRFLCELTSDQKVLGRAIGKADMGNIVGSNMFDPVHRIITNDFAKIKGRKAVVILTDGAVSGVNVKYQTFLDALIESDALIYPIIFENVDNNNLPPQIAERRKNLNNFLMNTMNHFANVTGGRVLQAKDKDFKKSFQHIADELKNQYIVGFYPPNFDNSKERNFKIDVTRKDVVIKTKSIIQLKPTN